MSPTFSIIIPVYNVAPYLRECLDSVWAQTYTDWEAICVDDGSTDGSGAILDEYAAKDKRFRVIHQANAGVSAARNAALDMATGEWTLFIDSDDYIKSGHLLAFVNRPQKSDVNFLPVRYINDDGSERFCRGPLVDELTAPETIASYCQKLVFSDTGLNLIGYTWNKFIRLSLIKDNHINFVPGLSVSEDEVFTYAVLDRAQTVACFSETGCCYRWHSNGLTHLTEKNFKLLYRSYKSLYESVHNKWLKVLLQNRYLNALISYYVQEKSVSAADLLLREIVEALPMVSVMGKKMIFVWLYTYSHLVAASMFCFMCRVLHSHQIQLVYHGLMRDRR